MEPKGDAFIQITGVLEKLLTLGIALKIDLRNVVKMIHYKKGTRIQRFKQIPDQLWFLVSGTAKEITVNEESLKEWVTWFWYGGDFMFTEPGIFNNEPTDAYIELIEDCCLLHIGYYDWVQLCETHKDCVRLEKKIRGNYAANRKAHQVIISSQKVKTSFDAFVKTHPQMINLAKHKDILEFLGSTDDSFRRLV